MEIRKSEQDSSHKRQWKDCARWGTMNTCRREPWFCSQLRGRRSAGSEAEREECCWRSNVSVIEQTGQSCLGKVQSGSFVRKVGYMVCDKRVPVPPSSLFLVCRDVPPSPDQPKVHRPNNEGSSRMVDEGCPNESPSVHDATGYSKKEEEEDTSVSCGEFL